jgi:hypothetical protein
MDAKVQDGYMIMTPALRKFTLTAHVTSSVGWFGAVGAFLALAVAGLASQDPQIVRAAYLAMELTGWFVIIPMCLASLPTGMIQSLGTEWGLFRHYWIVAKLLITVLATIILFAHMQPIGSVARVAAETTLSGGDLRQLRIQLVADAAAALFALLITTTLSVYKPRGLTPYGRRQRAALASAAVHSTAGGKPWALYVLLGLVALMLLVGVLHLAGIGLGGH